MTTNFHGPIIAGESNSPATVNSRLATLDAAIAGINSAGGGGVFTLANGSTATTTLTVDSTAGFVTGADVVYYHTGGTVREFNTVTVSSGTVLTLGTTPGGTIADNAVIAQVVKSVRGALESINYVTDYGAKGDGVTDDTVAINAALTAVSTGGGGTLYFPAGTYLVHTSPHPTHGTGSVGAAILLLSNVHLSGAGIGVTTIKLADDQNPDDDSWVISNQNTYDEAFTDSHITISDMTIDGNYANQGLTAGTKLRDQGIVLAYCSYVWHERVEVKNIFGLGATPATGEGFGFHASGSTNIYYSGCIGHGDGIDTNTASNFSLSSASNVLYTNCVAYGSGKAMGFTNNASANVEYTNCQSYRNRWHGFNIEFSNNVRYTNCLAGGIPGMSAPSEFGVSVITAIDNNNPCKVTAVGHGFVTGDKIYIGGNRSVQSGVASAEVQGMWQINDDFYTITKVDDDNFTIGVSAAAWGTYGGAYGGNGRAAKTLGNYYHGWSITDGWDIGLINCDAIGNGTGASRSGVVVDRCRRVGIVNGSYRHNSNYGIDMQTATFGAVRMTGAVIVSANDAFSGMRVARRDHAASTTIDLARSFGDSTIRVADSTGFNNGDTVHIQLDNGGWHITTITGVAPGASDTLDLGVNLPYGVSIGNAVYLRATANVAVPATSSIGLPAANPLDNVAYTNYNPFPVLVIIRGGTVSNIRINAVALGVTSGQFVIPTGGTILVNQTVNPTWFWFQAA